MLIEILPNKDIEEFEKFGFKPCRCLSVLSAFIYRAGM